MKKEQHTRTGTGGAAVWLWPAMGMFLCGMGLTPDRAGAESLCAEVKIEIRQELTLERQAFDAHMRINNGLTHIRLENVDVDVTFADAQGRSVVASSDPDNTNATFFIRVDSMENIASVSGAGVVAESSSADIHWLIIPAPGAAGASPQGVQYRVGARLAYTLGGERHEMDVTPDTIFVKPMPRLVLDYFLPSDVYGDDAFTAAIEPPVPFPLGVRVRNVGHGAARNLAIDSGQPKIVENRQGLLIGFRITGSEVNGQAATESLKVNFGDIAASSAGVARWIMECTLSGRFVEFTAEFSHSDELGGQLTSLMEAARPHFLVHDVVVDLPGRDRVRDFLARDGESYRVYESDNLDADVMDWSGAATLSFSGRTETQKTYEIGYPPTPGPVFVRKSFSNTDGASVISAMRSDGKRMSDANVWFSKTRARGATEWQHFINLFDADGGGTYTIVIEDMSSRPQPPVLGYIGDKVGFAGDPLGLGFLVQASDPNGTVPALSAAPLPAGAEFTFVTNSGIAEGTFFWRPQAGQEGIYPVRFTASDGRFADEEVVRLYVGRSGESTNAAGIPNSLANVTNVVFVSPRGSHEWPYGTWETAATNVQAAVDVGLSRVEVVITDGVYRIDRPIVVTNAATIRSVNGPDVTAIDAGGAATCFRLEHGGAAVVGLTITGGLGGDGAGVYGAAAASIRGCIIRGNRSNSRGGGVYLASGGTVLNCLVSSNAAARGAGIFSVNGGRVLSCTVAGNRATEGGGGVYWADAGEMRNTVAYGNTAPTNANVRAAAGVAQTYSCTDPAGAGAGNTSADPRYRDPASGDYRLTAGSPCINGGTNEAWMTGASDVAGETRVLYGRADIGAHEYRFANPVLTVVSAHGVPVPARGVHTNEYGTSVACRVSGVETVGTTQYVCAGWSLAGNATTNGAVRGSGTAVTFVQTNATVLAWLWSTNLWLDTGTNGPGRVDVGDGWRGRGTAVAVVATAAAHYHFSGWSGHTNGCVVAGTRITVPMDRARRIIAGFAIDRHSVDVRSAHGQATPPVGTAGYAYGARVECRVSGVETAGATRYVCTGWAMTGNEPASGSSTSVVVTVTNNAVLTWQWKTQHLLDTAAGTGGRVSVADNWYDEGRPIQIRATADAHYHFAGWTGAGTNRITVGNAGTATITVALTGPVELQANFELDRHALEIRSAHGVAAPPVGIQTHAYGARVGCRVSGVEMAGATRYVCTGWAMTGNEPASGSSTSVVVTVTNNAVLTWQWKTQYWLDTEAGVNGRVSPADGWHDAGTLVQVTATADSGHLFLGWTGAGTNRIVAGSIRSATVTVRMDGPASLSALFETSMSPNHFVSGSGAHQFPYTNWAGAATNIQDAVLVAVDGDTVWVAGGMYVLTGSVAVVRGVAVRSVGGAAETVVDGRGRGRCFALNHPEALLDGFSIVGGRAAAGGGVECGSGGGRVQNCVITDNSAAEGGGVKMAKGLLRNCLIHSNGATDRGGGVAVGGEGVVENCTIAYNAATNGGGGVSCAAGALLRNTVVYSNRGRVTANWQNVSAGVRYEHCASLPTPDGPGNVTGDPRFRAVEAEDYRLLEGSPCIDAGTNLAWTAGAKDLAGADRVTGSRVDIGAYEFQGGLWSGAADAGNGWRWLEWFGYFQLVGENWLYHSEYGWMYYTGTTAANIWFWSGEMGWFWSSESHFPSVFRVSDGTWVRLGGGLWAAATDVGSGWKRLDWFGLFRDAGGNWIYHDEHGWMYYDGTTTASVWFYTADLGWLWTGDSTYPYLWRARDGAWLWYSRASKAPRWFMNLTTRQWEQWNP